MDKLQARRQTLWDQSFESDACGMGFIAQIDGKPTHELVDYAMTILERMNHRGGTGAEPDTGDGAGALFAMPHEFFTKIATENNITLPNSGDYAVGQFFLPKASDKKAALCKSIRNEMQADGYQILMTRDVPFNFDNCGPGAQAIMPSFVQFIISKPTDSKSGRDFEDRLYRLRRKLEKTFATSEMFISSLSSKTIVYKGMLHAFQVRTFYPDLSDPAFKSTIALTHSRFSTNTFPSWDRAQPFRFLAHNGEINTLRGAENWMTSHKIEIYNEENSDSAKLENCMEYLYRNGREMPHALLMMIPEAWGKEAGLSPELTSFYEYTSSFMAPWDGPAALVFTDGDTVGARLDRNGLRPSRYSITKDNFIVCSSESGVVDFEPSRVVEKGVLGPGNMMLVDTVNGKILRNEEVKKHYAAQFPYEKWLDNNLLHIDDLTEKVAFDAISEEERQTMHKLFGYTEEVIRTVIVPMAENGQEPVIAMGYDSPLAVLSQKNQSLFTYFKQQFAQVTNPPIDAIREKIVVGTEVYLGRDGDLRVDHDENCVKLKLDSPVLTTEDFEKIAALSDQKHQAQTISTLYDVTKDTPNRLEHALVDMFKVVEAAVDKGASIIILSDRDQKEGLMPMPILLATSGLYNYMVEKGKGSQFSIVVDTAEVNEVHHFATIVGYGASAIHPYGAYETLKDYSMSDKAESFRQAAEKGIIKVMSRMGISTVSGYKGAQLFETVGLSDAVVDKYFRGTVTRISGLTLNQIEAEYLERYEFAYGHRSHETLPSGGSFQFKADGEHHIFNPLTIYNFQKAVRQGDYDLYKAYSAELDLEADETPSNLRHIWELKGERTPVALSEVEPVENIVKRFKVGAMSFGSLSKEAHETIAAAMNSIGAKSNSGEGGENRARFYKQADGTNLNSKIKQVASGRFGVNAEYLMSAEELQIKLAQGAKPGEGGQLPGGKAFPWVAEIRGSTPGVTLISPPPHHDIYSIEDLAQLIYDLKAINPYAKINVKLVSSTGVGTIATGCVKAGADKVVISGYDGGTGASPRNSARDAGLPWEMGLAEAHQTLTMNNLRQRMTLETDGKLMTGRDIAVAALLGAEEYSFASLALVAVGCVMMRVCSLNTCPVGVATQNPELRAHFAGKPEHVVNGMKFLAQELREIMADLGFRSVDEMIGHAEVLKPKFIAKGKAKSLDFSRIIGTTMPIERKVVDPFIEERQWQELDGFAKAAIDSGTGVTVKETINNVTRTAGARMAGWIAERYGNYALEPGLLKYEYTGIAGQSFASFATQGMEITLIGEANDYIAKSLSGGRVIVKPPVDAGFNVEASPIVGNVSLFGAVRGEAYFRGRAGERFCVRNSGAKVVVEGVGEHGCEYMTGGLAVILGSTGQNFAAGMSGGVAYVYDAKGDFAEKVNMEMVDLYKVGQTRGDEVLKEMVENHATYTDSEKAKALLADWDNAVDKFVKVYPREFHEIKEIEYHLAQTGLTGSELEMETFEKAMRTPAAEKAELIKVGGK
ncbi:glutamate synthase large subunit [Lactococcus laudensis]|uniref:Glutamate synthase large subunit n=1 Tax=Pseudolactococcus laudensis TaxID=1494461 RepID=A0A7V8MZW6_9LACT|nr:glutamate synthase large subunit [Lactococcus laudensis]MBA0016150.1 glutamate synthase large subunit [Lactococcus laudensis]MBW9280475.1 glutamate synthase large subunit [Lactococcus laudensis]